MNISPISLTSFGKKPVFTCVVKTTPEREKKFATLYEMNSKDPNDREEYRQDPILSRMKDSFLSTSRNLWGTKFYVLKDDETNETVSAAQTSRRYNANQDSGFEGEYTLVEELDGNRDYLNSTEPVIGQIANDAYEGYSKNIVTAFNTDEKRYLERYKFSECENGAWVLPEKRFAELRDKINERNQVIRMDN